MTQNVALLNIVGLSGSLLQHAPHIWAYAKGCCTQTIEQDLPALTTTSQSTMLTGVKPKTHGIVANGWFNHQANEIQFWKQSNALVQAEKIWDDAKKINSQTTTANICWWYNMYSGVDFSVTPRPIYKANGRKIPDCYTYPASLRDDLQQKLGIFPLFKFWGPAADITSTQWIADAAIQVYQQHQPNLNLVYLPHLDYPLQKLGPEHPEIPHHVKKIDDIVKKLLDFYQGQDVKVILLSEYGITPVDSPIHINRILREKFPNDLAIREEDNLEILDAGASEIFAVADHQAAHVYIKDPSKIRAYKTFLQTVSGIDKILDAQDQEAFDIHHSRSGDLLLISEHDHWFTYYYWLDDAKAPDFARTVDIHRKPGYDPCELFIDPKIKFPRLKIATKLFQKKILKQATLLDVIPLDATLVKGSHGNTDVPEQYQPLLICPKTVKNEHQKTIDNTQIKQLVLDLMFESF